jgi:hypothetical protein
MEMLERVNVIAGEDRVARAEGLEAVAREALKDDFDEKDRGTVLLCHALAEWNADRNEKAYAAIARTMSFCARYGQKETFRALQAHASLDDLRMILIRYCPGADSVDETMAMLSNLDAVCD